MNIQPQPFGQTPRGESVTLYDCSSPQGGRMQISTYGAILVSVEMPDRDGRLANVCLGFPTLAGYLARHPYFGATVGRYCNRIAGGSFELGGTRYQLATNNGPNHLHGGVEGFDRAVWHVDQVIQTSSEAGVRLRHVSPNGDEGYPGTLSLTATYLLTADHVVEVHFQAETDQPTPVNLTNHAYWNLAGAGAGPVLDHLLTLAADTYLPVDERLIPTGQFASVEGTPFDFRQPKPLGRDLPPGTPPGYDHCFALRTAQTLDKAAAVEAAEATGGQRPTQPPLAARVLHPGSGRVLEIQTTQPGIQLYTGNFLDGSPECGGFRQHEAFCLETQHFPDSPNQPQFPSTILEPGQTYRHTTRHRFSVE